MNVIAFAGSNSRNSINKQLVTYAASLLEDASTEILDLNDYELPLFSVDKEAELGQPDPAKQFLAKIQSSDALLISYAEHNGSYSAAYKNLYDWCSRIEQKVYGNKPAVYLATSPGPGGGASVLATAINSAPHYGVRLLGSLSVPRFYDNFDVENGRISNAELDAKLHSTLNALRKIQK